jgi:uncharacterized protein DUF6603/galactose oxidase-like protein
MTELGTFERLLAEIGQALLPLREALRTPEAFAAFVQRLGWQTAVLPPPVQQLGTGVETLFDSLTRLLGDGGVNVGGSIGDGSASATISADEVARTLKALQDVVNGIRAIADAPASAFPESLRVDGFAGKFPGQLFDYLVITYLRRFHPSIGYALRTLGVVKSTYVPPTGNRLPYVHYSLDLSDLPKALADPSIVVKNAFGWGDAGFDFGAFASQADNLLTTLPGIRVFLEESPDATASAVQGELEPGAAPVQAVKAVIFERVRESGRMAAEVRMLPLPERNGAPPGLALLPAFNGALGFRYELGPDIAVTITSDLDLQGGVGLLIRPGQPIEVLIGFESGDGPAQASGSLEVRIERSGTDGEPSVVLGTPDSTRLQVRKLSGTGGIRLSAEGADVFAEFAMQGLEFVFDPSDADGFIGQLMPGGGFSFGTDLTLGVSHRDGFYFRGTSNLQIQLPAHLTLGPLEIQGLTISVSPSAEGIPISLGTSFKAELGPIQAVVEDIGLTADLTFKPDHDGNLGPVDLSIGFKPPTGAGLSVNAGVVSGGGYLRFDPEHGEYAGALELEFANLVELKAIGLISTRMPDGSDGFSLLIIIATEFGGGGIQLGYGFTLLAVGGLIGLNRRMNLQALVEGVHTGRVESVMFPQDVIANAPRIISDLRAFFPPEQGTFLIGPMAKIGWGTPALITVSLGVIIEIPGNIAVLGVLTCALPTKELPLLVLKVAFIGAIEFDKSRLWFFAQLFDSRILFMTIEGGMGLLIGWGADADFVLSVGGFHPSFKPPPLPFPVPDRISVDILNTPTQLIRVSGYFAVTSNTVQFGAKAELRIGFDDFGLHGHLSFDALFRFSPFAFVIQISAGVSLKAFGVGLFSIDLRFQLEGPAPWRAHGRGSISLLFFEISADFDITWGEEKNTTLPPVSVLPLLVSEVAKLEGWETRLPAGGGQALVNLRRLSETEVLVLHPLGTLFVRQRSIPLGVRLDKIGAQRPSDGKRFGIEPAPGSGLIRASRTSEKFAMAQFQDMDDAAKLSRPAYEDQDAGLELVAEGGLLDSALAVRRSTRYELHIVDSGTGGAAASGARRANRRLAAAATPAPASVVAKAASVAAAKAAGTNGSPTRRQRFYSPSPAVFGQLIQGSSTTRSPLSQRQAKLRQPFEPDETVQVTGRRFVVAYRRNNHQAHPPAGAAATTSFRSQATAEDALAEWLGLDARLAGQLHVIRDSEVVAPLSPPGTWSAAGAIPTAVSDVEAVPLAGGKVLVAGGTDQNGLAVAAAALFDPVSATWAAIQPLPSARRLHALTELTDGRVLVTGGLDADGLPMTTAVLYDPVAGTWAAAPSMATARCGHSATLLLDSGRVLVAGGTALRGTQSRGSLASAELYDPMDGPNGTWTATASMTGARSGHTAVALPDRRVLVAGGVLDSGRGPVALAYCDLYDPEAGTWAPTGSLSTPRAGHQATALDDGTVLVTGGDPSGVPAAGKLRATSLDTAERYDPDTGAWTPAGDLPGGRGRHRSLPLRSGGVLVIGGTSGPTHAASFRDVAVYEPSAGTWTATGRLAAGRSGFAATELTDGRVLVAGGAANAGVPIATTEIFTP